MIVSHDQGFERSQEGHSMAKVKWNEALSKQCIQRRREVALENYERPKLREKCIDLSVISRISSVKLIDSLRRPDVRHTHAACDRQKGSVTFRIFIASAICDEMCLVDHNDARAGVAHTLSHSTCSGEGSRIDLSLQKASSEDACS